MAEKTEVNIKQIDDPSKRVRQRLGRQRFDDLERINLNVTFHSARIDFDRNTRLSVLRDFKVSGTVSVRMQKGDEALPQNEAVTVKKAAIKAIVGGKEYQGRIRLVNAPGGSPPIRWTVDVEEADVDATSLKIVVTATVGEVIHGQAKDKTISVERSRPIKVVGPELHVDRPQNDDVFPWQDGGITVPLAGRITTGVSASNPIVQRVDWSLDSDSSDPTWKQVDAADWRNWQIGIPIDEPDNYTVAVRVVDKYGHATPATPPKRRFHVVREVGILQYDDPTVYLQSLLTFAADRIKTNDAALDTSAALFKQRLGEIFHQPFVALSQPENRLQADRDVSQARLAIAVLRQYLQAHERALPAAQEQEYVQHAYSFLLQAIGTNLEELQEAQSADAESRKALARRLGFILTEGEPDRLAELMLDPETASEEDLERLFGLQDTRTVALEEVGLPDLLLWRIEALRERVQESGGVDESAIEELEDQLKAALDATIAGVETVVLPPLRDAIIAAIAGENRPVEEIADRLSRELEIDCRGGRLPTTRLTQALETMQSLLFSLRAGRGVSNEPAVLGSNPLAAWELKLGKDVSGRDYTEEDFDQEWQWMGSFATWRAAAKIFNYPENHLEPSLVLNLTTPERKPTRAFRDFVREIRFNLGLTTTDAHNAAAKYLAAVRDEIDNMPDPLLDKSFEITDELSTGGLAARREQVRSTFLSLTGAGKEPKAHDEPHYIKEIFYLVPMLLALQLQKSGEFLAALDWYRTVYAHNLRLQDRQNAQLSERKIYYGLELEAKIESAYIQGKDWLLDDSLNPHLIAVNRQNAYTRFTIMSIARCLLGYADAEFTRATNESVVRARSLYLQALDLLSLPEMLPESDGTENGGAAVARNNPIPEALRLRGTLNLAKLRDGRDIAGFPRQRRLFGFQTSILPSFYRYAVLVERAKQWSAIAQQIEASYLAALEKRDAAAYTLLRARQDLEVADITVDLQGLRVEEAAIGKELAQLQKDRSLTTRNHFAKLLDEGLIFWEHAARASQYAAAAFHSAAGPFGLIGGIKSSNPFAGLSSLFSSAAAAASSLSSAFQMQASFERREQEWELQLSLAAKDVEISQQQIQLAEQQFVIVEKERELASVQRTHAEDTVNFLTNQFTNEELYEWMSGVLGEVYRYFLQQTTAIAQLAQEQLAFERQEIIPAIIQVDYWEPPASLAGADGRLVDRRGLTGSARLLQDIFRLDQHAFETNQRKLQLSQSFSLAQLAPVELQQLRETGQLVFATPMVLFDRSFPGHYLRLIKQVRVSIVALIPPIEGVRATLAASGISRVVVGRDLFQTVEIQRAPEQIAFSSTQNATGLLELQSEDELLLPFEGMGVDATWLLELPKAANAFDYRTIADVILTVDYSALHSYDYRQKIISQLDATASGERAFSFRQEFADAFYDLNNPAQSDPPMVVRFETRREDFPPNLDDLKIQHVLLLFARAEDASFDVPVIHLHFTEQGGAAPVGGGATSIDGVISTRRSNGSSWLPLIGQTPFGKWELALPDTEEVRDRFKDEEIEDILLVVTYRGRTPAWPE